MTPRSSSSTAAIAVAATGGAAALLLTIWLRSKKQEDWLEIPSELEEKNCPYAAQIRLAMKLAIQAGDNMKEYCDTVGTSHYKDIAINTKGQPEDFCTAIDLQNEALIEKGILQQFSTHVIIGEESTGTGTIPSLTNKPTWILDPIDGTTNFSSAIPLTCVSIGYCEDGRPVMGVVYAPLLKEMYIGVRGHGAYRNGIRLNPESKNTASLKNALVAFEFGYTRDHEGISKMLQGLERVLQHGCRAVRGFGSGVLDLCHVARGSIDVVYAGVAGEGWKPWDYCAGMIIATEAGCCIESLIKDGENKMDEEFDIYSTSVICAVNKGLLAECQNVVCKGL